MDREMERAERLAQQLKAITEKWADRPQLTTPTKTTTPNPPAPQGAIRG